MDSKIPKASSLKKPTASMIPSSTYFHFHNTKGNSKINSLSTNNNELEKQPLSEINRNFIDFKFRSKSPEIVSNRKEAPKLRRSKSACELRSNMTTNKRAPTSIDLVPNKRIRLGTAMKAGPKTGNILKTSASAKVKPIMIETQAKRTALLSSIKSSSTTTVNKVSSVRSTSSSLASKDSKSSKESESKSSTLSRTRKPPPYDFKARFTILLETHKELKEKHSKVQATINELEEKNSVLEVNNQELQDEVGTLNEKLSKVQKELDNADRKSVV